MQNRKEQQSVYSPDILPMRTTQTQLAMIIDPAEQTPEEALTHTQTFLEQGGSGLLIGGSGYIPDDLFQHTASVMGTLAYEHDLPLWVLPGHISQIPESTKGISGILHYRHIMGDGKVPFESVYPRAAQEAVTAVLTQRSIPDIPTLYVLCGDPTASVSKISGVGPLNLQEEETNNRFVQDISLWLDRDIACVFFESGSNSLTSVNQNTVQQVRQLITDKSPDTKVIVSGGIRSPEQAKAYAGIADFVVVGGHFERNNARDTASFVTSLQ